MAGPAVLFGNVLDRVLFPAMSQLQRHPEHLAEAYRRGVALIALVMLPASAVLLVLAPELVDVVLGPAWREVVLPLQILGAGMLFRTSCKLSDSLVRATGAVYARTWRQTAYAVFVLAGAWVGHFWGIPGVAAAVFVTLVANFLLMAQLSLRLAAMPWRTFWYAHVPGLALAGLAAGSVGAAASLLRAWDLAPVLVLVASVATLAPSAALVACMPGIFLGEDGRWMVRTLIGYLPLRSRPIRLTQEVAS
jgi:PST family polysaccharide transporter